MMSSYGNSEDPAAIHNLWSTLPYGEEPRIELSARVALQLPCWTSQLRLAFRGNHTRNHLTSLLLPHIWNKVQQQVVLIDDHDHDLLVSSSSTTTTKTTTTSWKEDYMIQHWHLTRFHMVRESSDTIVKSFRLVRQIMDRIDEYYYNDSSLSRKQRQPRTTLGSMTPQQSPESSTMMMSRHRQNYCYSRSAAKRERKKQRHGDSHQNQVVAISPIFINWVASEVMVTNTNVNSSNNNNNNSNNSSRQELDTGSSTLRQLCRKIVANRPFLNEVQNQLTNLPLSSMAARLIAMGGSDNNITQEERQGRALLMGLLVQGQRDQIMKTVIDPLPPALILWNGDDDKSSDDGNALEVVVDKYLASAVLPNVNSLVIWLWSHRGRFNQDEAAGSPSKSKWASWLPVDPIVPLVVQELLIQNKTTSTATTTNYDHHYQVEEMQSAINFLLALHWDDHHVRKALAPLFGTDTVLPLDSMAALKQACADALRVRRALSTQIMASKRRRFDNKGESTAKHREFVVQQMWGASTLTNGNVSTTMQHGEDENEAINDEDHDDAIDRDDYDYVDEADDRILLL